jgi:4-diphosphocytidyl-2-C-methyl-D-erythritol kinase
MNITMPLHAPAKINLFLKVLGKRPDRYHELLTLMCPIGLYDEISLHFGVKKTTIHCSDPAVPRDETNIAHRAAKRFFETAGITDGVHISIHKNIPVAAGLGGGSSDAATVLLGLNRFLGSPISKQQLLELGASIGADVPFFVFQKPAIATGIGEILEPYDGLKPHSVVLIYPGFGVSTADIFKKVNLRLTNCKKIHSNSFFKNGVFDASRHIYNDLETISASLYPEIRSAKESILDGGAIGAAMSGSGSSVFGLFADPEIAKKAYQSIQAEHTNWQLYLVDLIV